MTPPQGTRVLLLGCALAVGLAASAYSFGPRPNEELAALANQAAADSAQDPLRAQQLTELEEEIARLCGQHADGRTPDSCAYTPQTSGLSPAPGEKQLDMLISAVDDAPESSRPLLVRQAVQLAVQSPLPDTRGTNYAKELREDDAVLAQELLAREHAALYTLEAAVAFVPERSALNPLLEYHSLAIAELSLLLGDQAQPAAAGYVLPADPASVVPTVEQELFDAYLLAATHTTSSEFREILVHRAAQLHRDGAAYDVAM